MAQTKRVNPCVTATDLTVTDSVWQLHKKSGTGPLGKRWNISRKMCSSPHNVIMRMSQQWLKMK